MKTKGGREMNPTDAYRKQARKREIKRNRAERHYIREAFNKKTLAADLKAELEQLIATEQNEELTKLQKLRKKVVQEAYENAIRKQKVRARPAARGWTQTCSVARQQQNSSSTTPPSERMLLAAANLHDTTSAYAQAACLPAHVHRLLPAFSCICQAAQHVAYIYIPAGPSPQHTSRCTLHCTHHHLTTPFTTRAHRFFINIASCCLQEEEFRKRQAEEEGKQLHAGLSSVPLPKPPPLPAGPKPGLPPPPGAPPLPAGPAPAAAAGAPGMRRCWSVCACLLQNA
jgi:hypothetical protein